MNIYCTLDTETVGGAANPKGFYHLGGLIHDRKGKVYGCFNYLIADMLNKIQFDNYAKPNMARYEAMLANGNATLIDTEDHAIEMVEALLTYFKVNHIMAYNSSYDFCKTKCANLLAGRTFIDLWLMALQTICQQKRYSKFCADYGLFTKRGVCRTTAEAVYAFLTDTPAFQEEHTALEDSKIEKYIFEQCVKTHKKYTKNCHCWNMPKGSVKFPKVRQNYETYFTICASNYC